MPKWKSHLVTGALFTLGLFFVLFYLGIDFDLFENDRIQIFILVHAVFISILGSLVPDFDYWKTKIRYALGPVLGIFIFSSFFYLRGFDLLQVDIMKILVIMSAFLIVPIILGLIIPFKHQGMMHSLTAALCYAVLWTGAELLLFQLNITQSVIIGSFGFIGYSSHLILDGKIKLI